MWMTPAYDADTKTLYVAIGNPSPDLDGSIRPGDNLWTESIVALDAVTGKFKWGYQEVPHEDRKSARLNSSHSQISYAVFCLKKKQKLTSQLMSRPSPPTD